MSNGLRLLLIACLVSVAWGNLAEADLVAPQASAPAGDASLAASDTASSTAVSLDLLNEIPAPATRPSDTVSDEKIRKLPAAPSSAALFLSGLLSMGAWRLTRSAGNLHFGALPEWYHTGGPTQIGHVVPFDFEFAAVPACWGVGQERRPTHLGRNRRDDDCLCDAHAVPLTVVAARAPPCLAVFTTI
ncbi:MAG: hypothetical protein ACE5EX_05950 [Phycisphaerae bacterium]